MPIESPSDDGRLGIENGFFRWNQVEQVKDERPPTPANSAPESDDNDTTVERSAYSDGGAEDTFELKDINVMFPSGKLSVISGPTASGKTALLVGRSC
jgi:hypothetical protein